VNGPSSVSERAAAWGYLGAWRAVGRLSEHRTQALFMRLADRLHRRDGSGVQQLRANLSVVRPELAPEELDDLVHAATRSYLRYWAEAFRLPRWPLDDLVARTVTVGEPRLRTPYQEGRGVIAVLPHQGNWDWAGAWACATGMPLLTVAERLRPERLYDEFVAFREGLGMQILPLTGGEDPTSRLEQWLRAGGFVCLLADRHLGGGSVEVDMCGRSVALPVGPALLSRRTGALLVPATTAYDGPRLRITFHEPVAVDPEEGADLRAPTQAVADAFTVALRRDPEDWHMMQRVFPGVGPVPHWSVT
jgi:phosphatidylinositol dimannoside acyltransferase